MLNASSQCFIFYVRTQFATISRSTSASCGWRTSRAPCGQWTRSSSTGGGRSEAAAQGKAETRRLLMMTILIWSPRAQRYRPHFLSNFFRLVILTRVVLCPSRPLEDARIWYSVFLDISRAFSLCCEHSTRIVVSTPLFLITNLFLRFWYCITPFNIGLGLPELYHKCTYY